MVMHFAGYCFWGSAGSIGLEVTAHQGDRPRMGISEREDICGDLLVSFEGGFVASRREVGANEEEWGVFWGTD